MIHTPLLAKFLLPLGLSSCILLTGCESLKNVDQGLYNIAESLSEQDRVTGQRTLSLASRSEQISSGNDVVAKLLTQEQQQGRRINQQLDKAQYWRMIQIFDRIHSVSHLSDERWQPILIDRDSFNAFTTGGTRVVVHLGLMQQLKSDDEVAAVLAHEIAHTVANHVFEGQSLAQATSLANSNSSARDGYKAAFTQENEREADRIGVLYSALSGFDPLAASRIWKRQFEAQGNQRAAFFHSHPANGDREQQNRRYAGKVALYYRPDQINPNHAALLQDNALWSKRATEVTAGGAGGGLSALTDTLFGAYVQHQQAKQGEQQQTRQMQLVRYVQSQLKITGDSRPAPDRWRLQLQYSGEIALQGVTLGGKIGQGQDKPALVMIAQSQQTIPAGSQFELEFKHRALKTVQQPRESVELYLDDALQAP
ncbi:MAG: putative Zn-dependent protease [Motiliproteus sp.]|jgi:predicted Zn-dependent protease